MPEKKINKNFRLIARTSVEQVADGEEFHHVARVETWRLPGADDGIVHIQRLTWQPGKVLKVAGGQAPELLPEDNHWRKTWGRRGKSIRYTELRTDLYRPRVHVNSTAKKVTLTARAVIGADDAKVPIDVGLV